MTTLRDLQELLANGDPQANLPTGGWKLKAILSDECASYVAWNEETREALLIDPKDLDFEAYHSAARQLKGYLWLGVIDTHTHADHISIAAEMANQLQTPLIMHQQAPSQRVDIRVTRQTQLPSRAAPIHCLPSPGHTPDGLSILWGPFLFAGDTVLFGDTGRDDLPGGDPEAHYQSIQLIKSMAQPETILLPGHDHKGGRASSWATQLQLSPSLTQDRETFVSEAAAFSAPAPKLLKESLRENFR